jgi:iron complex transport system ATP-binding protein
VEEIMPVFSHALILRRGRILAAGRKSAVLNAKRLSAAFGARLRLRKRNGRYTLRVSPASRGVV